MATSQEHSRDSSGPAVRGGAPRWEHFDHGADIGVRGIGASKEEAFAQAALALTGVITNPDLIRQTKAVNIACDAPDDEVLLVDWLNALITEMACHGMLFGAFEVHIGTGRLQGVAHGEPIDQARHEPGVEIKGATFTCLQVRQNPEDGTWTAQCVVDV